MRLLFIASLLTLILLAGCFGPSTPAPPQYKPPVEKNLTPNAPSISNASGNKTPAKPVVPPAPAKNQTPPSKPTTIPPKVNLTVPKVNTTVNNSSLPIAPPAAAEILCSGLGTSDALECLIQASIAKKDAEICTQLTTQDDRYKCFTRWCYSAARDYHQCDKLQNPDDRTGCLMKCNTNFNT